MTEKVYSLKLVMNQKELSLFDLLELEKFNREELMRFLDLLYILEDKTEYENTIISQGIEKIQDFLYPETDNKMEE